MKTIQLMLSLCTLSVVLTSGCQEANRISTTNPAERPPVFYEDIVHATLCLDLPLIDEDGDREPDGISVRLLLLRANQPDYVAGNGKAVIHLYRRVKSPQGPMINQEMYKWTVGPEDFARAVVRQRFGFVAHQMSLYWGNLNPKGPGVYLQAEYIRTDGKVCLSRPVSVALPIPAERSRS